MKVNTQKPLRLATLRFGRYLPRAFAKANPFLGSWVSPININFPNRLIEADLNTLRGRLDYSHENSLAGTIQEAFKEKWFRWRIKSYEQTIPYEKSQFPQDDYKFLIFHLNLSTFKGESSYRRFLTICAIIEYFSVVYKGKLKILFFVFDVEQTSKKELFRSYHSQYHSSYFMLSTVGLLGSLTTLNKIYKLCKK